MPSPTEIPADRPAYRTGLVPSAPLPREPPAVLGCRRSDLRKHRLPPTGLPAGRRVSSLLRFSWFLQFLALPPRWLWLCRLAHLTCVRHSGTADCRAT